MNNQKKIRRLAIITVIMCETSVLLQVALPKLVSRIRISGLSVRVPFPPCQFRLRMFLPKHGEEKQNKTKSNKTPLFVGFLEPNSLFVVSLNDKPAKVGRWALQCYEARAGRNQQPLGRAGRAGKLSGKSAGRSPAQVWIPRKGRAY